MKKIISLLLITLAFTTMGCDLFKTDDEIKDPENLEQGEKTSLTGRIHYYYEGDRFFTLEHKGEEYTIFIDNNEKIVIGEYIRAEGTWEKEANGLAAEKIHFLSENEKADYFKKTHSYLEIKILEYPKQINHTCETPKFKLEITNAGNETITHKDLHTYDYEYALYYFINDMWVRANADRENYVEVKENITDDEKELIGLLSNQGIFFFDDLKPGQKTEVAYWAGGEVSKNELGTAGSPNIFGNQNIDTHEFSFAWGIKNNYDPIFLFKSEKIDITMLSDQCNLGL